jgi:hypothetical protein
MLAAAVTLLLALPALPVWQPSAAGYSSRVKAFWFGANASGLDSDAELELIARHAVGGYGWQTGWNMTNGADGPEYGRGDAWQSAAMAHARGYMEAQGEDTTLFQYRQIQVAFSLFAQAGLAKADPANEAWWLHDSTGRRCLGNGDPYWNFSSAPATAWWLERFIGQIATDSAMLGGRSAVFFDEVDQGTCGYRAPAPSPPSGTWNFHCDFAGFNNAALQASSNAMLAATTRELNAAGIVPIYSMDNRVRASGVGLPNATTAPPCALPEDDLVAALKGLRWVHPTGSTRTGLRRSGCIRPRTSSRR